MKQEKSENCQSYLDLFKGKKPFWEISNDQQDQKKRINSSDSSDEELLRDL